MNTRTVLSCLRFWLPIFPLSIPVSLNRQGNDIGINYRTGIYTNDPKEAAIAKGMLEDLQRHYSKPIQIEVEPLNNFCPAEEEHQNYLGRQSRRLLPYS